MIHIFQICHQAFLIIYPEWDKIQNARKDSQDEVEKTRILNSTTTTQQVGELYCGIIHSISISTSIIALPTPRGKSISSRFSKNTVFSEEVEDPVNPEHGG